MRSQTVFKIFKSPVYLLQFFKQGLRPSVRNRFFQFMIFGRFCHQPLFPVVLTASDQNDQMCSSWNFSSLYRRVLAVRCKIGFFSKKRHCIVLRSCVIFLWLRHRLKLCKIHKQIPIDAAPVSAMKMMRCHEFALRMY
jgi:hypothetical protein